MVLIVWDAIDLDINARTVFSRLIQTSIRWDHGMGAEQTGSCEHEARETETLSLHGRHVPMERTCREVHQGHMRHLPLLVVMMRMIETHGDDVTMIVVKVVKRGYGSSHRRKWVGSRIRHTHDDGYTNHRRRDCSHRLSNGERAVGTGIPMTPLRGSASQLVPHRNQQPKARQRV
jgi:hypothetical protein